MTKSWVEFLDKGDFIILLFHGVVFESPYKVRNYSRKHLEVKYFRQVLVDFLKLADPISMDDIVSHVTVQKPFNKKSFAVTFDDGFENNLSVAAPVLKELGIPATIYVSTALIEENGMSWIDKIEYLFERISSGKYFVPWKKEKCEFSNSTEKISLLTEIRHHVKSDPNINSEKFVSDIFTQLKTEIVESSLDPLDLKLNWFQIKELMKNSIFQVGGHSHHHVNLAFLSNEQLRWEVSTSLKFLKEKAGIKTHHYAYPEGLEHCYSPQVISELKRNGVKCSPTAIEGTNFLNTDLFDLRRIMVI